MTETNAEFLARTASVEDGVTAGPWQIAPYDDIRSGQQWYDVVGDEGNIAEAVGHWPNAAFVAAARMDYPEALRRLAELERVQVSLENRYDDMLVVERMLREEANTQRQRADAAEADNAALVAAMRKADNEFAPYSVTVEESDTDEWWHHAIRHLWTAKGDHPGAAILAERDALKANNAGMRQYVAAASAAVEELAAELAELREALNEISASPIGVERLLEQHYSIEDCPVCISRVALGRTNLRGAGQPLPPPAKQTEFTGRRPKGWT